VREYLHSPRQNLPCRAGHGPTERQRGYWRRSAHTAVASRSTARDEQQVRWLLDATRASLSDALGLQRRLLSGGAGIRTPVRDSIHHDVYVRSPPVKVSDRWPVDSPLSDKSTEDSLPARRHRRQLARIFDTCRAASGGLPGRQVRTPKRYAARAKLSLAFEKNPRGLTRIREPGHAATASLDPSKPVAP
jgi:hypothetical protein